MEFMEHIEQLKQLIKEGNCEDIHSLLVGGLDPNTMIYYETILEYAFDNYEYEIVRMLIEFGADVNNKTSPALVDAASKGDRSLFEFLLSKGADINAVNNVGHSALSRAIAFENFEAVTVLIDLGISIEMHGGDSLRSAAWNGDLSLVKRLVELGANLNYNVPDQVHSYGATPLAVAAGRNHVEVVEYLIKLGADITTPDLLGERAYHIAKQRGYHELAEYIKQQEPKEFHDFDLKKVELLAAGVPLQIIESIGTDNRRLDFQGDCCEFLVFRTIFEVTHFKFYDYEVYDLLEDLDNYGATGVITWCPNKQCFVSVDIEHHSVMILEDMTWDLLLEKPGYFLDRILEGDYETEELDIEEEDELEI
ncbi:MAG: ankyrin repeat domain-containing protein [Candidatus Pristimantibacillus sp.]